MAFVGLYMYDNRSETGVRIYFWLLTFNLGLVLIGFQTTRP